VARAQYDGLPISADVSAHQLHLTEIDVGDFDSQCHVLPPLRTQRDRDGLRQGLAKGTLQAICSDHQPHEADAKFAPFAATAPGISALESLLPLGLRLVDDGVLSLPELIARLTYQPAQVLGAAALGTLSVGASADICLFDPEERWEFSTEDMLSRGRNTPFAGWQFKGRAVMTVFEGNIVFERGDRPLR
jgi:dihydroorotase